MADIKSKTIHVSDDENPKCSANSLSLFDINWQDVLIPHVVCYLSLKDLFNLRCCSRDAREFVETTLEGMREINLSGNNSDGIELCFSVLAKFCKRVDSIQLAKCCWLTDELLLALLMENVHRLHTVNLNGCENVTPLGLHPIIVKSKDLRVLKMSKCQWLTTGAVDALTLHQNNLVEFDISHCTSIGERCLIIFFRKLNQLTILSLAYTPSVTDQVLVQIGRYCRSLKHLNITGCASVTNVGICAIATKCPDLKSLLIHRNPQATKDILLANQLKPERSLALIYPDHEFKREH